MHKLPKLPPNREFLACEVKNWEDVYWQKKVKSNLLKESATAMNTERIILDDLDIHSLTSSSMGLENHLNIGYLMLVYLYGAQAPALVSTYNKPETWSSWRHMLGDELDHISGSFLDRARDFAAELGLESDELAVHDLFVALHFEDKFLRNVHYRTRSARVIFSTEDGFMGVGPGDLQPGDEVVVPFGSSRPWVLACHGDHHVLLGDAVVPGIISGQLQILYEEGILAAADYILR